MAARITYPISQWLERLSSLHRSLLRKFAADENLQFVHVEILQYLSVCNRYSDTAQAISNYLGQTKGSISQSLAILESSGYIKRTQSSSDKRIYRLSLLHKGVSVINRMQESINLNDSQEVTLELRSLLSRLQQKNGLSGFEVCSTCKHNQGTRKNGFVCTLTSEPLSTLDVTKICQEHKARDYQSS